MFTRKPRLQPAEFLIASAKRLLQHNLPEANTALWLGMIERVRLKKEASVI
jgi:hypothetical protein